MLANVRNFLKVLQLHSKKQLAVLLESDGVSGFLIPSRMAINP
jgi:hypothetical protein